MALHHAFTRLAHFPAVPHLPLLAPQANREAATLVFTSEKQSVHRPTTTAALVANHK